jgi:hypothetical protein
VKHRFPVHETYITLPRCGGTAGVSNDDGRIVPTFKPASITSDDVTAATHIFAIGCSLPAHAASSGKAENWTDVPEVSDGYAASRDAIRKHVEPLIDQLQKR